MPSTTNGADQPFPDLLPAEYEILRRVARRLAPGRRPRGGHEPESLLHLAYVKWKEDRNAPRTGPHRTRAFIKRIEQALIELLRNDNALKRGGGRRPIDIDLLQLPARSGASHVDLLEFAEALEVLERRNERHATIVRLHVLAGLSVRRIASLLGFPVDQVKKELEFAKSWLKVRFAST